MERVRAKEKEEMEKEDEACSAGTAGGRREEGASDGISLDKVRGRERGRTSRGDRH